jgi:hypothetical protein
MASYAQSVPELINYQGKLTDANGMAIENGIYQLEFNIYDAKTGGVRVWGPQVFEAVPVVNGFFNVILGEQETDINGAQLTDGAFISTAFLSGNRFLGVKINSGNELLPRQQVLSSPYAIKANKATHHSNIIPPGSIQAYWGTSAPIGWLKCNGQVVPKGVEYESLRQLVGSNVPDLRGTFLRGWDDGKGLDNGRSFGTPQDDTFQGHAHKLSSDPSKPNVVLNQFRHPGGAWAELQNAGSQYYERTDTGLPSNDGSNGTPRISTETRPKNIAVSYIIKY